MGEGQSPGMGSKQKSKEDAMACPSQSLHCKLPGKLFKSEKQSKNVCKGKGRRGGERGIPSLGR